MIVIHTPPWIKCLLSFTGAWAVMSAVLNSVRGFTEVPGLSEKHALWTAAPPDTDTLFIGSSRIFHGFDPDAFADAVSSEGLPRPRAFNAGADAMFPPESFCWLRELLGARPPALKWIFLEYTSLRSKSDFGDAFDDSARGVWWHDMRHTGLVLSHVWRDPRLPPLERIRLVVGHLRRAAQTMSGTGRSGDVLSAMLLPKPVKSGSQPLPSNGYVALSNEPMNATDTEGYRRQLADRLSSPPQEEREMPREWRAALEDLVKEIRDAGAELVLIEPPTSIRSSRPIKKVAGVMHLCYNAVETNAEWYAPEGRYDGTHINGGTAKKFSAQMGRDFAALIKKRSNFTR